MFSYKLKMFVFLLAIGYSMIMYELVYSREVLRSLRKLANNTAKRICAKLEKLAKEPYAQNNNVKALKGNDANYRLRIGDWRALYILDSDKKQLMVTEITIRGEAYKS